MTSSFDEHLGVPDALERIEVYLLGETPSLTRVEVAEAAAVPMVVAEELWRLLGFPHPDDDTVAFTPADVEALVMTKALMRLGVLSPDSQAALVRTWGRSFARLAEWETTLLAEVATAGGDPETKLTELADEVLPRVEALQSYIWRRHLASAASRLLAVQSPGTASVRLAVGFVDIVGYTSQSRKLDEHELVEWLERFEDIATGIVVDHGGRIIKTIGDEVLFVADDPATAAEIALRLTERGTEPDGAFPSVRAGVAYGEVVNRLGDVFGPVVNVASRLTSIARPDSVIVDQGMYEHLSGRLSGDSTADPAGEPAGESGLPDDGDGDEREDDDSSAYRLRRMRRLSVKGYSRLQAWVLRRPRGERAD